MALKISFWWSFRSFIPCQCSGDNIELCLLDSDFCLGISHHQVLQGFFCAISSLENIKGSARILEKQEHFSWITQIAKEDFSEILKKNLHITPHIN